MTVERQTKPARRGFHKTNAKHTIVDVCRCLHTQTQSPSGLSKSKSVLLSLSVSGSFLWATVGPQRRSANEALRRVREDLKYLTGPVITSRKSRTRYRGTRLCHQWPRLSHRFVTFRPQDSFSRTRAPFLHKAQTKKEKKAVFLFTFSIAHN
ncbi:hypothetical protein CEXT_483231 [Caerostris extrusa]|uniref:Uncharacterized protein n=1 Tax=Caerostris extrusa TaxID=172846 RepID=A0AAV4Y2J5_CAEEX|nr:hypothetical protein CEXT_483231 [Caerostris extrusa]